MVEDEGITRRNFLAGIGALAASPLISKAATLGLPAKPVSATKKILTARIDKEEEDKAVRKYLDLIRNCQIAETPADDFNSDKITKTAEAIGAIALQVDPNVVWVSPAFGSYAALGMLTAYDSRHGTDEDVKRVARWLKWYANHEVKEDTTLLDIIDRKHVLFPAGSISDYVGSRNIDIDVPVEGGGYMHVQGGKFIPNGHIDSHDSTAGIFLALAERYQRVRSKLPKEKAGLKAELDRIIKPNELYAAARPAVDLLQKLSQDNKDGMTSAGLSDHVYYLMDNIESYAGMRAGADLFANAGDTQDATLNEENKRCAKLSTQMYRKLAANMHKFHDAENAHYHWYTFGHGHYGDDYRYEANDRRHPHDPLYPQPMAGLYGLAFDIPDHKAFTALESKFKNDYDLNPAAHPIAPAGRWLAAAMASGTPEQKEYWRHKTIQAADHDSGATAAALNLLALTDEHYFHSVAQEMNAGKPGSPPLSPKHGREY